MNNKIIKISAIFLIIVVLLQFILNSINFYKKYKNLQILEEFNDFSSVISSLLHRTQQERGAAAGYIGSKGYKFKDIYMQKIIATDERINDYFKFLKNNPDIIYMSQINLEEIQNYMIKLQKIRKQVFNLKINLSDEVKFYSDMNSKLLEIMDKLIVLTNNEQLVKALMSYDAFEKAKEKIGIERAVLSGTFSMNKWDRNLYIKYVTLLAKQKVFLNISLIMSNSEIRTLYNKIKKDEVFNKVCEIEKIALYKEKDFGINSVYWYNIITKKLNLLDKIDIKMYKYNNKIIEDIKHNLVINILINLTISLLILFFVIYTLILLHNENKKLFYRANYDQLTGLYNRLFFISEFNILKDLNDKNNTKLVVMFIDLDGFKDINDSLGHEVGDEVLKEIARRIKSVVRKSDIVARFGGDEFLIMLNEITDDNIISDIGTKLLHEIKKTIIIGDTDNRVSASIGISIYPDDGDDINTLIKNADMSMYKSKNAGKDRITFYEDKMSEESNKRLKLKNDLYHALENEEFELYYQPQIDKNNKLVGMEVLLRWNHHTMGVVSPAYFIPLAIDIGFIEEIDLWVMKHAIMQAKSWLDKGYEFGIISCNMTIYQLERNNNILYVLKELLEEYNVDAKYFGLEITEEGIMKNPKRNISLLHELKNMGITISIDDFGTGYSSFAYLKKLPIDKLKIDRTFIKDLEVSEDDKAITSIIISLAKQLHLKTVAEGVETPNQRDFVFAQGCDSIQGFLYSKPLGAYEFENKFLKGQKNGNG